MADSPDINLKEVEAKAKDFIKAFVGSDFNEESDVKIEVVEVAFGLKALDIKAILDEEKGSTDKLEEDLKNIDGVKSVEVTDVRRIIG